MNPRAKCAAGVCIAVPNRSGIPAAGIVGGIIAAVVAAAGICSAAGPAKSSSSSQGIISFNSPVPPVEKKNPHLQYDLDPRNEKFFVWMPAVPKDQVCGLIVFVYSDDRFIVSADPTTPAAKKAKSLLTDIADRHSRQIKNGGPVTRLDRRKRATKP
jgi:hypothetical protein